MTVASENRVGFILAGGGSTRFGRDKALADVGGTPMLLRMIQLVHGVPMEARVIGAREKYEALAPGIIEDTWPGEGPLGGIITALEHAAGDSSSPQWCLILSCDMPFLTRQWLAFLGERALKSSTQVVLPFSAHGPEPLCACYRIDSAGALRAAFQGGVRKVTEGLKRVTTEVLDESVWKRFDSAGRLFWNMNTPADYEEVRRILETERV